MTDHTITMAASAVAINGLGVIIAGKAGSGKSQCCLQLLDRGHHLIADDGIILNNPANEDVIYLSCPQHTQGLMHHHQLGFLDITILYPNQIVQHPVPLALWVMIDNHTPSEDEHIETPLSEKIIFNERTCLQYHCTPNNIHFWPQEIEMALALAQQKHHQQYPSAHLKSFLEGIA